MPPKPRLYKLALTADEGMLVHWTLCPVSSVQTVSEMENAHCKTSWQREVVQGKTATHERREDLKIYSTTVTYITKSTGKPYNALLPLPLPPLLSTNCRSHLTSLKAFIEFLIRFN
jgi:hypothetical protein